jgi:hypothetical protein
MLKQECEAVDFKVKRYMSFAPEGGEATLGRMPVEEKGAFDLQSRKSETSENFAGKSYI